MSDKNLIKSEHEIEVIKQKFLASKVPVKGFQSDHLVQLKVIIDKILEQCDGDVNKLDITDFSKLSKNLIALTDKMRKQDEGIKINTDMNITQNEFRKIIDIEATKIEAEDIPEKNELRPDKND